MRKKNKLCSLSFNIFQVTIFSSDIHEQMAFLSIMAWDNQEFNLTFLSEINMGQTQPFKLGHGVPSRRTLLIYYRLWQQYLEILTVYSLPSTESYNRVTLSINVISMVVNYLPSHSLSKVIFNNFSSINVVPHITFPDNDRTVLFSVDTFWAICHKCSQSPVLSQACLH